MKQELELKQLDQFCGTEQYTKVMGSLVTDGIAYIMENGYSWFVTDFLAVAKTLPEVKQEPFISIKLVLNDSKGEMIVTDGNEKVLYKQQYEYTDAKKEPQLFYVDNVLMLQGEY